MRTEAAIRPGRLGRIFSGVGGLCVRSGTKLEGLLEIAMLGRT